MQRPPVASDPGRSPRCWRLQSRLTGPNTAVNHSSARDFWPDEARAQNHRRPIMDMTIDDIFNLTARRGTGRYGLSAVSQLEHALQSAALATQRHLGDDLVIAALFHDLGH